MNAKLLMLLVLGASVAILVSPAVAGAPVAPNAAPIAKRTAITPQPLSFVLSCTLRGKPVFAPKTDVVLTNKGVAPVPVGTKVRWFGPLQ
jgi:hypothetical protein